MVILFRRSKGLQQGYQVHAQTVNPLVHEVTKVLLALRGQRNLL